MAWQPRRPAAWLVSAGTACGRTPEEGGSRQGFVILILPSCPYDTDPMDSTGPWGGRGFIYCPTPDGTHRWQGNHAVLTSAAGVYGFRAGDRGRKPRRAQLADSRSTPVSASCSCGSAPRRRPSVRRASTAGDSENLPCAWCAAPSIPQPPRLVGAGAAEEPGGAGGPRSLEVEAVNRNRTRLIGCPDRCLDLALAMQKACGSLAQQIRGKRAFPRSLARAGATRAQARRKICPTHVHPPIQSLSPLSLATKNRPTKLAYLACIGPGQPWPGSLMRARFTREVNQSDPKGKNSMQPGCKLRPLQPLSRVHLR